LNSDNAELEDVLRGLEGVSYVEKEVSLELTCRDVLKYIASAMESGNIGDLETFLNTKVQGGTKYRRVLDYDGTTVLGWAGLALDEEVTKAVEEHEGIEYPLGIEQFTPKRLMPLALSARAETGKKQEKADKALLTDY
jgi:hypothetical protein